MCFRLLAEAPEFHRDALEALREPLETGVINVHRARVRVTLPAKLQLVMASNPCPCGLGGSTSTAAQCTCTSAARVRYAQKISGPLRDRIDVRLRVAPVPSVQRARALSPTPTSNELRGRVMEAQARAQRRLGDTPWKVNSQVSGQWLRESEHRLTSEVTTVLDQAVDRGRMTIRGYDRTLRLAWTIADLAGSDRPSRDHVASALRLREERS